MIARRRPRQAFRRFTAVDGVRSRWRRARSTAFSARTARARPRRIRMIAGLLKPTAGRIRSTATTSPASPRRRRRRSASSPTGRSSTRSSPPASSCASTAASTAWTAARRRRASVELLELFELTRWRDELVESFSHGMKQRLVMCAAFLHARGGARGRADGRPRPARRAAHQGRLPADGREGVAILMSTHTLEVAEEMCDRISIILGGRIIAEARWPSGALAGRRGRRS